MTKQYSIQELGLDKGEIATYKSKPNRTYFVFNSTEAMNASLAAIDNTLVRDRDHYRVAVQENTIELLSDQIKNIAFNRTQQTDNNVFDHLLTKVGGAQHIYESSVGPILSFRDPNKQKAAEAIIKKQFGEDSVNDDKDGIEIVNPAAINLFEQAMRNVTLLQKQNNSPPMPVSPTFTPSFPTSFAANMNQVDSRPTVDVLLSVAPTQATNNSKKLICIDFDDTLVNAHYHNAMSRKGFAPSIAGNGVYIVDKSKTLPKAGLDVLNSLLIHPDTGLKNSNAMRIAIMQAIDNGHNVAITSFTKYPEVIVMTLEKLKLEKEYIDKICVVGGFPKNDATDLATGKKEHMLAAMNAFNMLDSKENRKNVLLIDDNANNVYRASTVEHGFNAVQVPKNRITEDNPMPDAEYINKFKEFASAKVLEQKQAPIQQAPIQQAPVQQTSVFRDIDAKVSWYPKGINENTERVYLDKIARAIGKDQNKQVNTVAVGRLGTNDAQITLYFEDNTQQSFQISQRDFLKTPEFNDQHQLANFIKGATARLEVDKENEKSLKAFVVEYKTHKIGFFSNSNRGNQLQELKKAIVDGDIEKMDIAVSEVYKQMFNREGKCTESRRLGESKMEEFVKSYISKSENLQQKLTSEGYKDIPRDKSSNILKK